MLTECLASGGCQWYQDSQHCQALRTQFYASWDSKAWHPEEPLEWTETPPTLSSPMVLITITSQHHSLSIPQTEWEVPKVSLTSFLVLSGVPTRTSPWEAAPQSKCVLRTPRGRAPAWGRAGPHGSWCSGREDSLQSSLHMVTICWHTCACWTWRPRLSPTWSTEHLLLSRKL